MKSKEKKSFVKRLWEPFKESYGVFGIVLWALMFCKISYFYYLIGPVSGLVSMALVSFAITAIIFLIFRNKWIPAIFYTAASALMFADVLYDSFFDGFISINMIGGAEVIDNIASSIREQLRPEFFLLLADCALIFADLTLRAVRKKSAADIAAGEEEPFAGEEAGMNEHEQKEELQAEGLQSEEVKTDGPIATEDLQHKDAEQDELQPEEVQPEEELEPEGVQPEGAKQDELQPEDGRPNEGLTAKQDKLDAEKPRRRSRIFAKHAYIPAILLIAFISLTITDLTGFSYLRALSRREFYCYHIADLAGAGGSSVNAGRDSLSAFQGNYDREKVGPYYGIAEGRNLIVLQLESFQGFPVGREYNGQELTPVINSLIKKDSIYFDRYYQQTGMGNTSDAEFATNNSIFGSLLSYTYKLYPENYYRGLPVLLSEKGYDTAVFHAYEDRTFWNRENAYPALGFRHFYGGLNSLDMGGYYEPEDWIGWGIGDHAFFKQSVEAISRDLADEPFYAFMISLSNHHPFDIPDEYNVLELLPEDEGTLFGNYLKGIAYTDYAVGELIKELKRKGLYENSVICMYGDHMGLPSSTEVDGKMRRLLGYAYDDDEMLRIPLIINIPGSGVSETVHTAGGQLDFMPTIASLMGFEKLDTLYLGHNLLSEKEGFAALQTYVPRGSFVTNDIFFEMAQDGIFEHAGAWNMESRQSVELTEELRELSEKSIGIVEASDYILKSDALKTIYLEGQDLRDVGDMDVSRAAPEAIYPAGYPDVELVGKNNSGALRTSYYASNADERYLFVSADYEGNGLPVLVDSESGKFAMTVSELLPWMDKHEKAIIVADISHYVEWFMEYAAELDDSMIERIIPVFPSFEEYTGRYEGIINLDKALSEEGVKENLAELISSKKPWGFFISDTSLLENVDEAALEGIHIYHRDEEGIYRRI